MPFEAKCGARVSRHKHKKIVKVLLTVESGPAGQDEHLLCNLLEEHIDFEEGDTVEVTLRKVKGKGI
jgi:hypothetical protein